VPSKNIDITFLIPCLNEEKSLEYVINEIQKGFSDTPYNYEILVSDNGSSDSSVKIAERRGATVLHVSKRGYGSALSAGIAHAKGKFIVMGDADGSYTFSESKEMFTLLENGCDLVMGNRFAGGIFDGAMPFLHRYLGNPVLSFLGRLFFGIKVRDFHCGLRAFKKEKIENLGLQSQGMEFASEMIVKAKKNHLVIGEVPVTLKPDLRDRPPHLRTWHDGWRHLRFLLSNSPLWLFMVPSLLSLLFAFVTGFLSITGPLSTNGVGLSYRTSLISSALALTSLITTWYFLIAKETMQEFSHTVYLRINKTWPVFAIMTIAGLFLITNQFIDWSAQGFQFQPLGQEFLVFIWGTFLVVAGLISSISIFVIGIIKNSQN
jgi:glycosyltransferase involved in cell wall biosynthesis